MRVETPDPITYFSMAFSALSITTSLFEAVVICLGSEPIAEKIDPSLLYFQLKFSVNLKKQVIRSIHQRTHYLILSIIASLFEGLNICLGKEPIAEKVDPSLSYFQLNFSVKSKKQVIRSIHQRTHYLILSVIRDQIGKDIDDSEIEICNIRKRLNSLIVQFVIKKPANEVLQGNFQLLRKDETSQEFVAFSLFPLPIRFDIFYPFHRLFLAVFVKSLN